MKNQFDFRTQQSELWYSVVDATLGWAATKAAAPRSIVHHGIVHDGRIIEKHTSNFTDGAMNEMILALNDVLTGTK